MIETPFIGAYWSAREESRESCAERTSKFLASITPDIARKWYLKSNKKKGSRIELGISTRKIAEILTTNCRDTDGTVIPELGFTLAIWNGSIKRPVSLSVTCGAYSKFISNAIVLNFPQQTVPCDENSVGDLRPILEKIVEYWDPDDAVLNSNERIRYGHLLDGWLTYKRGQKISFRL